ncbi:regulatory protein, luxR family [Rhizobiales bacterium GAS113]|nr:regulatory protein, luxR family [Rhizobiales bacterium GAS113]
MGEHIREITSEDLKLFGEIIAQLERLDGELDVRGVVLSSIVKLVKADFAASYIWNERARRFDRALIHNMDPDNIQRYEDWYQFRDPHTFQLRAKRRATLVEEVTPYPELRRTEFYNDFLKRDGLHHGVNIFLFDGDRDLGDFRLWRAERSADFSERETAILNALAPYLQRALVRNGQRFDQLTTREREVAFLVARGCRDRDIGKLLGIGFSTVRTHLNKAMEKKGCANRAELAATVMRTNEGTVPLPP